MKNSPESRARTILEEFDRERRPVAVRRPSTFIIFFLIAIMGLAFLWLSLFSSKQTPTLPPRQQFPQLVSIVHTPPLNDSYIRIGKGVGERDDLWLCVIQAPNTCTNITSSPTISESWPSLSYSGELLAYYALSDSGSEVYLYKLIEDTVQVLTANIQDTGLHVDYHIVLNGPPKFSPNSEWLAFPAKADKSEAIEIFVVRTDGQLISRLSDIGKPISDYIWVNNNELLISIELANGDIEVQSLPLKLQSVNDSN